MLNLTQHVATVEQIEAGVVEPSAEVKKVIQELLTFNSLEETQEITERAFKLARIAKEHGAERVMVGGAPFLMGPLESMLAMGDITAHYAFSQRVVEEVTLENGTVEKKALFKHMGFVPPVE